MKTLFLISALAVVFTANAQTVKLTPVPSGFTPKMGGYRPQQLQLTDKQPENVKKLPDGLTNAKFGLLPMGGKEFAVCIGDLPGKPGQLFIDTNRNGDLTDDPTPVWTPRTYKYQDGSSWLQHIGSAKVGFHLAGSREPVSIGVYEFDPKDTARAKYKDVLMYYCDYGFTGSVTLAGKEYPIIIADDLATGNFSGKPGDASGITLRIDRDHTGKFAGVAKTFDTHKPFNIDGTTYELGKIASAGGKLKFKVSKTTVAEIVPPPPPKVFKVGSVFPGFTAASMDNTQINFPTAYKGHVVMLDFWATWCGPCIGELPNITAAYEKFHDKGFDILGVTLDQKDMAQKVIDFTKEKKMSWPQIYDGGFWKAAIAVQYDIQSIPHAFLVDGDTGELLADGNSLRGEGLSKLIEQVLEKKGLLKQH